MKKTYCAIENPFSANKMFVPIGQGKLIKSKQYREWIETTLPLISEQLEPIKEFPVEIELVIYSGTDWQNKRDIDNCIKPIIDLLVRAEILPDDTTKYIENVSVRHVWMKDTSKMVIYYHQIEK